MKVKEIFPGVFRIERRLFTKNSVPGKSVYGEKREKIDDVEYRNWDPHRSKPAAAMLCGLKTFPIKQDIIILYLGIANGTTASHFSDIVGPNGAIFGIDMARKTFEKLLEVCEKRQNIVPILADANHPAEYEKYLQSKVDILYQDVAQKNQIEIFVRNAKRFLKKSGYAMIAIKARCVDVTKNPSLVFKEEIAKLEKEMKIIETVSLGKFEKDHIFVVAKFR